MIPADAGSRARSKRLLVIADVGRNEMRTRIWLTVLVTLLLIVVYGLLFPRISGPGPGVRQSSQARNDVFTVVAAANHYYTEYGSFPGGSFRAALAAFLGANPRKIVFIELPESRIVGGVWLDPWDTPYRIDFTGTKPRVWSAGPDKIDDSGNEGSDDLTSWR